MSLALLQYSLVCCRLQVLLQLLDLLFQTNILLLGHLQCLVRGLLKYRWLLLLRWLLGYNVRGAETATAVASLRHRHHCRGYQND